MHVTDSDGEAQIVALRESHSQVALVKRYYLANHLFLCVRDRVQLNASVSGSELKRKIIIHDRDSIGVHAVDVMLIDIIAIA